MPWPTDRRSLLAAVVGAGALLPGAGAAMASAPRRSEQARTRIADGSELGLVPDSAGDQSAALQQAIDKAASKGVPLRLPAGRFRIAGVRLRAGTSLAGAGARTVLVAAGPGAPLSAEGAHGLRLEGLALEGSGSLASAGGRPAGLVEVRASMDIALEDLAIIGSPANGLVLEGCSGRVAHVQVSQAGLAGLLSLDAAGLEIVHSRIGDCANNGILVWRSRAGEDGTLVAHNRIERIGARAGGSGQNGNGINVFRAAGVLATGNRIADCAYSAIRANAASNVQMVANSCMRIGEVALYAEFGFEGALIAANLVDGAATGISVTNFNEGGRLAVVQGNLIRNLRRREHEPEDKRGEGIAIEADAAVTGNTIEGAPTAGIVIGWGPYMRDVALTGNVIRKARVGIMITRDPTAGAALIAQNLISGAPGGAIRLMDKGRVAEADLTRVPPTGGRLVVTGNHAVDDAA